MPKPPFFNRPPGAPPVHPGEVATTRQLDRQRQRPNQPRTAHWTGRSTSPTLVPGGTSSPGSSSSISSATPQADAIGSVGDPGNTGLASDAGHAHPTPPLADATHNGYLSQGDWGTFTGKEPPLGNPASTGEALTSTPGGARSWVTAGQLWYAVTSKVANYNATASDDVILADATGGVFTVTLRTPVGIAGKVFRLKRLNAGANNVTIATSAGTIDGAATLALITQYQFVSVISDGTNYFTI